LPVSSGLCQNGFAISHRRHFAPNPVRLFFAANRLRAKRRSLFLHTRYDENGNRIGGSYVVGDNNQLLSDGVYNYQYDAEDNRILRTEIATGKVIEYEWDHRNRLIRVTERASAAGPATQVVEYTYDYLNRWIARAVDTDGAGPLGFDDTYFVYDGTPEDVSLTDRAAVTEDNIGQIVLQFDDDAQGAPQLSHRYLWGDAVDQVLADEQVDDVSVEGDVLWALTDHLGTVRDLAEYDDSTCVTTVANHRTYDAFGRLVFETNAAVDHLFGFTGRVADEFTGLQNNLNRWYDPVGGCWVSIDPIGFAAADSNPFRYVGNQAVTRMDPTGLVADLVIYINTNGAPKEFNFERVREKILQAFKDADADFNVYVIEVKSEPPGIGRSFDREPFWNGYPWHPYSLWIVSDTVVMLGGAAVHTPFWYWPTRNQLYHNHYVFFNRTGLALGQGGAYRAPLNIQALGFADLWLINSSGKTPNWDVSYANLIIHEVLWHGVLDHGNSFASVHSGDPGTLGYGKADSQTLLDLRDFMDDIEEELD